MTALQKTLGFYHGLALYLAAVLGTGILVVPLLAWNEAGPSSLIAWFALGILGFTLAWTFASVGAQEPDAGGVQSMIGRVFGVTAGKMARYLVFFSIPAGAVAGSYILGYHLCAAFDLSVKFVPLFALAAWVLITAANYKGLKLSANVQLVLSAALVVLLLVFVGWAAPSIQPSHFHPFFTHGLSGLGNSAIIVFWSFMGWEAIAHLAEEFENPARDMMRAAIAAALLVGVLYLLVSIVLIGSGATTDVNQMAPLVKFAAEATGSTGRIFIGVFAAAVCLGTANAYMAGLSRLTYSMARDGDLPKIFTMLSDDGTPRNCVLLQFGMNLIALASQLIFRLPLKVYFLIPNLAFLLLYIFGCLAGARLLKGNKLAILAAYFSAAVCAVMLPFAHGIWLVPIVILSGSYLWLKFSRQGKRANAI